MSADRNLVTGDVLANLKGDTEKYGEGIDRIFGERPRKQVVIEQDKFGRLIAIEQNHLQGTE